MKIESRGKYPGVKIHLDPDECELLIQAHNDGNVVFDALSNSTAQEIRIPLSLAVKMGKKIAALQEEEPGLLTERTPEQVKAILAKEVEKAKMQLANVNAGLSHKDVDKDALKKALLKHVE